MTTTMTSARGRGGLRARALGLAGGVVLALAVSGAASAAAYIDADLTDLTTANKTTVANPQPVQLLFQFETKGALNAKATKILKDKVVDAVKSTGFFTDISDTPTANGAVLEIVIDNAPKSGEMAEAEGKGFVTGATLGLAGSTVRDNYNCTVDYVASPTATKITRTANDGVYFQMGLINSPPANATKIGRLDDAVFAMTRYIVVNPLNALAADPGFGGVAAPGAAPATSGASPTIGATPAPTPGPTPSPSATPAATTAAPTAKP